MTDKIRQDIEKRYIQIEDNFHNLIKDIENLSFIHPDIAPVINKLKKELQNLRKTHSELNNYFDAFFVI